jgi:hypothetical protein
MSKGISGKWFKFIRENIGRWNVSAMVRNLWVSESGFYRFINRLKKSDESLLPDIKNLINEHICNDNYGRDRARQCGLRRLISFNSRAREGANFLKISV